MAVAVIVEEDATTISTAITGWTCELCAKDAILVADTVGNEGCCDACLDDAALVVVDGRATVVRAVAFVA